MNTVTATPHYPQTVAASAGSGASRIRSLGGYTAPGTGEEREIVRVQRPDDSALVVDYQLGTLSDGLLVARLAPGEPAENAQIVCDLYLADDERRGHCRAVTSDDFDATGYVAPSPSNGQAPRPASRLQDTAGDLYRISEVRMPGHSPELRWTRSHRPGQEDGFHALTLRDVVDSLEAYEPARRLTRDALGRSDEHISTRRLREELERLTASPVVLNRGLREAVQHQLRLGIVTMSEIALRCGHVRSESTRSSIGDTSWLARRIGQMPEAGEQKPCPWIHSDVLALIARDGLGICPHEVEL